MAVAIRLRRSGAKKRPFYRIVVAHAADRPSGKYIESLGYYNPIEPTQLELDVDKAVSWLNRGAQPSETVRSLLAKTGALAKWRGEEPVEAAAVEEAPPEEAPAKKAAAKKAPAKKAAAKKAPAKKAAATEEATKEAAEEKPAKEASEEAASE